MFVLQQNKKKPNTSTKHLHSPYSTANKDTL